MQKLEILRTLGSVGLFGSFVLLGLLLSISQFSNLFTSLHHDCDHHIPQDYDNSLLKKPVENFRYTQSKKNTKLNIQVPIS